MLYSKMVYECLGAVDVVLNSVGHKNSDNAVCSQRLDTECRRDRAVLSSRNAEHGVTARSVLLKEISYPLNAIVLYLLRVKHRFSPLFVRFSLKSMRHKCRL